MIILIRVKLFDECIIILCPIYYWPDIPGCQSKLLEAAGGGGHRVVSGGGGVEEGDGADRGELRELGQVVEDGVEDHRHKEVTARVLVSVIM